MTRLPDIPGSASTELRGQPSLLDMIPLEDLQQIQDALAEINGVASVITDTDGNPLTMPSNELALCDIIRKSDRGNTDCTVEFAEIIAKIKQERRTTSTLCVPLGIYKAAVPIIVDDMHLANWWITQCSDTPRTHTEIVAYAERIGVDYALLKKNFGNLPRVDEQGFNKTLQWIDSLTRRITRMGYQNLLLTRNLDKLHHLEDELNFHRAKLEDLVERRTAELMKTNNRLQLEVMERDLADEQVERKYKLLDAVNQILKQTLTDQSEHRLAQTFIKAAKKITGSPFGFLVQHGEQGWQVAAMQPDNASDGVQDQPDPKDEEQFAIDGIWKHVVESGNPIALSSVEPDDLSQPLPSGCPRIDSLLAVPLRKEYKTSGFIVLANNRDGYALMDQHDVQDLSKAFIEALKRRKSQRMQSETENRFSLALELANEGMWDYSCRIDQIFFSARWFEMLGYAAEEFPQTIETWHTLSHPDDLPILEGSMRSLCSGEEKTFNIEIRMLAQSGHWRWFQVRGQIVERDGNGDVIRLIGSLIDVSKYKQVEVALQKANDELIRLAALDDLTQIANRRRFDDRLTQEWRRAQRDETSLAVVICDIDFFKNYNDAYGHLRGDDTLYAVAQAIQATLKRPMDLVARYGGEEFAVILPATDIDGAKRVADQIKTAIDALQIAHNSSTTSQYITLSFGAAAVVPTTDLSLKRLIEAADQALYRAKAKGRNRIEISLDQLSQPEDSDR